MSVLYAFAPDGQTSVLACNKTKLSLVPRPEEEEKGPGFSRSRMRLVISDLTMARVDQWEGANDALKVTRSIA